MQQLFEKQPMAADVTASTTQLCPTQRKVSSTDIDAVAELDGTVTHQQFATGTPVAKTKEVGGIHSLHHASGR
jgi:hypothetical protein